MKTLKISVLAGLIALLGASGLLAMEAQAKLSSKDRDVLFLSIERENKKIEAKIAELIVLTRSLSRAGLLALETTKPYVENRLRKIFYDYGLIIGEAFLHQKQTTLSPHDRKLHILIESKSEKIEAKITEFAILGDCLSPEDLKVLEETNPPAHKRLMEINKRARA